jgi:hypothetical protein
MQIDEARRKCQAFEVDVLGAERPRNVPDGDDPSILDSDVGKFRRSSRSVNN